MKSLLALVVSLCLIPVIAQANGIQKVVGVANGKVRVYYTAGQIKTKKIFDQRTSEKTLVKKLTKRKFVALQANSRKFALGDTVGPNDLELDKLNLVDDVSYADGFLAVPEFTDEVIAVVVAKRGANVDLFLIDREDGDLIVVDETRFDNQTIAVANTKLFSDQPVIKLRNTTGTTVEQATVVGEEDIQLVQRHDAVTCANQWYESHAHMEDLDAFEDYIARLNESGVGCSLLFVGIEWDHLKRTYAEVTAIVENNPGRFIPFYNGDPNSVAEISVENLQAILDEDTDNVFRGIGEFAFYSEPLVNTTLTADPWPDVFQWAADNNLIIMVHLNSDQGIELDTMLDTYPNTTVLLHGGELALAGDLATVLAEHDNLYFTLDTAHMLQDNGPIMFPVQGGDDDDVSDKTRANDFVETYDANEAEMLAYTQNLFTDVFAAAPDRVLWGTDTAFTWHTRPAVYRRLIEFSNVVGDSMLSTDLQTDYFTTNAQALLGDGVTIE